MLSHLLIVAFCSTICVAMPSMAAEPGEPATQASDVGVLTLINGDSVEGRLQASETMGSLDWQGTSFISPFQFQMASVKSIKFPERRTTQEKTGRFAFDLVNGDVLTGDLVRWSADAVSIRSKQFGLISLRLSAIDRMYRLQENATLVFSALSGLQDWTNTHWKSADWNEENDHLWTEQAGAILNGDLMVPPRAAIEFELSWSGKPNFVLAIGTDVDSESDEGQDGWRFETYANKLAVVRDTGEAADVAAVADLTLRTSIRLTTYLDQTTGEMKVFFPDHTLAAELQLPENQTSVAPGRGLRVINRGSNLRLKRLRIARWLGNVPSKATKGQASVVLADGSFLSGAIQGLDVAAQTLSIGQDADVSTVDWKNVVAVQFASSAQPRDAAQCALFTKGGSRLSGNLDSVNANEWVLSGQNFQRPVRVPRDQVRTLIVFQHENLDEDSESPFGRKGKLEIGVHRLTGRLVATENLAESKEAAEKKNDTENENTAERNDFALSWHPEGSRNASGLKPTAAGRIVYRENPSVDVASAAAQALAMQRRRLLKQKRGLNFGQLFLRRADDARSAKVRRDAHVVHIRSGDVIACRVESMDEKGIHLSTIDSEQGFVPHADVKAVELVPSSPPPDLVAAKRDRLLTIPRLQKSAPPTHLLCSHNGDFLRCRLLQADRETFRVEVQLEELEIPRDRVAQIIWFHPDESTSDGDPAQPQEDQTQPQEENAKRRFEGLVQVLKRDGKRVTFRPEAVTASKVSGTSLIIGECSFSLADVDQLILGDQIAAEVSDLAYNKWKLQPAIEPLVTKAMEGGASAAGSESALIGKPAPELRLDLLDGSPFRLSDCKGQVVVLDFWATWCAPCMQTMPLVEAAIAEFDPKRVRLVSVNLEESAKQIRSVMERHDLNMTVALDVDGVAAQRYQARAIPQLVIIDPEGNVSRLYVGGGSVVVEQMKAAISELIDEPAP